MVLNKSKTPRRFFKLSKNGFFKAACLGTALLVSAPALANVTRVSELVDVDPNVWAYKALKELVEKYDVLEGYPDKTFKGNRNVTRYELAQTLYELLKVLDVMDSGSVSGADMETVGRLKRQFDKELSVVRNKVASLEGRVSALEADALGGSASAGDSWTDRIRVSGDLTNNLRHDLHSRNNTTAWGTRARLGVDATLLGQNPDGGILGEGIAHVRLVGGNGVSGRYDYATAGNNLDDIFDDASLAGSSQGLAGNFDGVVGGDARMDIALDQAYYTQVFNFKKTDPCSNEVSDYPNFFAVADLGQQDMWNTFHKSLVREDSLDGFVNQRVLQGLTGGSTAVSEGIHLGLNWLGEGAEGERTDACGNPISNGMDACGNPLPGFFQAFSLDFAANAINGISLLGDTAGDIHGVSTNGAAHDAFSNISYSLAGNLLHDLPGEFLGTGLLTLGANAAHVNNNIIGGDDWGWTFFTKLEQYFGVNRTFGLFADYSWASADNANAYIQGPVNHLVQLGGVLNTSFLSDTWNFNKDQIGLAYSYAVMHEGAMPALTGYLGNRSTNEHVVEAYYRKYITENISLTPDVTVNFNPNGGNKPAASIGFRSTFKLPNWNDGGAFDQFGYRDWSQKIAKYKAAHSLAN